MRALPILLSTVLGASIAGTAAVGQAKKPSGQKPAAATKTRYFQFTDGLMEDLPGIDAFLKEERQGGTVTSAVLDVCHDVSQNSTRKDRFVVALKPAGDRLTGSGQSQDDKVPVKVDMIRTRAGAAYNFGGSITRGPETYKVTSEGNQEASDSPSAGSQEPEEIVEAPKNFAEDMSPDSLGVKVKREALAGLVNALKQEKVKVHVDSLAAGCDALRSGDQIVRLQMDPGRAAALVQKLKTVPGVSSAGWTSGGYSVSSAIRIDAAAQQKGAEIDRDQIAAKIAAAEEKSVGAKLDSVEWDAVTGELTVKLKRPNQTIPQLGLTDRVETKWLVSSEGPEAPGALVLWQGEIAVNTIDEGPAPRLDLVETLTGDSEVTGELDTPDSDALLKSVAHDVNGRIWDSDQSAWIEVEGQRQKE